MNINNSLQALTQEVLDFSDVIGFVDDPIDADFRQACTLFSQHINNELNRISTNNLHTRPDIQQTTSQLYQLNELITPADSDYESLSQWPNKLHNFCDQIESLKHKAA